MRGKATGILTEEMLCAEYAAVYHFALVLCSNNPADAGDLVQETFLRALGKKKTFSGNSSLYTWLCAIAKNIWLNNLTKRKREMPVEDISLYHLPDDLRDSSEKTPDKITYRREQLAEIYDSLEDIREPYKEVFCLRIFGSLSFAAIGKMYEKSDGWARVTYYRARKMLREQLGRNAD